MSALAVEGAKLAGMLPRRLALGLALVERSVESVFVPLTRLPQSKSKQTAMQPSKHITINLVDRTGVIFDQRSMANTTRVVDLEILRRFGAYKIEVPSTTRNKKSNRCIKRAHVNAQKYKLKNLKTSGGAQ